MEALHLELRLTHHYVGTYSHLDEWEDIAPATAPAVLTPPRLVNPGNNYDEGGTYLLWATLPRLPRRADRTDAAQALEDSLSSWGCHHEYDCCGCASYRTRVLRRKGRRVLLRMKVSRNY